MLNEKLLFFLLILIVFVVVEVQKGGNKTNESIAWQGLYNSMFSLNKKISTTIKAPYNYFFGLLLLLLLLLLFAGCCINVSVSCIVFYL